MSVLERFSLLDRPRPAYGRLPPEVIPGIVIHLPQAAGEETRTPVVRMNHRQRTVGVDAPRLYAPVHGVLFLILGFVGALHCECQLACRERVCIVYIGRLEVN